VIHKTLTPDDIFQCKQCGDCCTGYGGTYLSPGDIRDIAEFIQTDSEQFLEKYCQSSGGRPVIRVGPSGKCVFFHDETQCTIHPVKPRMCRAWPFIDAILKAPGNWNIMGQACPGIKTGVPHDQVQACVKKEVEALDKVRKDADK